MDDENELSRQQTMQELEPSPVEDTPREVRDTYFPDTNGNAEAHSEKPNASSSHFLGLSSHSIPWYLNRIQRYSSYAFSVFAAMHITNTSIIPLVTRSVPASESYLLLTRPYYQSPLAEPVLIITPLIAHIGSGIALRLYRRRQDLQLYGAEKLSDRRRVAWPKVTGTSKLGYAMLPLLAGHVYINRIVPLVEHGGSSSINLGYVSHAFARHPAVSFFGYAALIAVGVAHTVWGAARWAGLAPSQVTTYGAEGQAERKRKWWAVNVVSALVAGLWMAGGLGVVGKGGEVGGWVGREYDELYRAIPVIGQWM